MVFLLFLRFKQKKTTAGPLRVSYGLSVWRIQVLCWTGYGGAHWPLGSFAPTLGGTRARPTLLPEIQVYFSIGMEGCTLALSDKNEFRPYSHFLIIPFKFIEATAIVIFCMHLIINFSELRVTFVACNISKKRIKTRNIIAV